MEYIKYDVSLFCVNNRIIHQASCSHTSQQNVERKHRHILNIAHTLIIHMHIPKYLRSNATIYAHHLINRMSSLLFGKSLFACLYPEIDMFPLLPQFFGYIFCSGLDS